MSFNNLVLPVALRLARGRQSKALMHYGAELAGDFLPAVCRGYQTFELRKRVNVISAWRQILGQPGLKSYRPVFRSFGRLAEVSMSTLIEKYDIFLCDLYGVFQTATGLLPGARETINELQGRNKRLIFISNTADNLPENIANRYRHWCIDIGMEDIYTSGQLLADTIKIRGWQGQKILVLGTESSGEYVRRAGAVPVDEHDCASAVAVVLAHTGGFDYTDRFSAALNLALKGVPVIVANSDITAQKTAEFTGITGGAMGLQMEAILGREVAWLGKPFLYSMVIDKLGLTTAEKRNALIIGDTLQYDIAGAQGAGVDSLLVLSGTHKLNGDLPRLDQVMRSAALFPTYILPSIQI